MKKVLSLLIVLCLLMTLSFTIVSCGSNDYSGSDYNHSGSEVCGICGGDGVVTYKSMGEGTGIQKGFDTYYRCGGCHGSGTWAWD